MAGPGYDLRLSVGPGDAVHLLTSFLSLTVASQPRTGHALTIAIPVILSKRAFSYLHRAKAGLDTAGANLHARIISTSFCTPHLSTVRM
jgi:hypothetical protein